jgi:L-amino acid N-acyltransferase YncA
MDKVSRTELVDGSVVSLRRLDADDSEDIVRLYDELTDDDRYFRFFTMRPAHLASLAQSLTVRSDNQYALGAFDSGKLIGVANYIACRTPGEAEVAVVVAHAQHLRGVGTALLRRLGEIAKNNGLHRLVAEVLAENHLMLQVISDACWPCTRKLDGSVLHVEIDLDAAEPNC